MIRTAIIGISGFADVHYRDLRKEMAAGRIELIGATVRHPEKEPEKIAELKKDGCAIFSDYREMLTRIGNRLDLCINPTGIHMHAPITIDAMRSGANVLVEKPVAALFAEVLAMQAAESKTGKFAAVGYQDMYSGEVHGIKEAILQGRIGRIHSIKGIGLWPRQDSYYARNQWAGRLEAGGHTVLDMPFNNALAHYLMMMLFFAGKSERDAASPRTVLAELFRGHDIESCDTAGLRIETDEGVTLDFLVTHCSETNFGPKIRVVGDKGSLEWMRGKPTRIELGDGRVEELPSEDLTELRGKMFGAVMRRIHDPSEFICTVEMAGRQTLCANAALKSCEIRTVPAKHIIRTHEKDSVKTVIAGIDEAFHRAFDEGLLLSETGIEWARSIKAHPVDTDIIRKR